MGETSRLTFILLMGLISASALSAYSLPVFAQGEPDCSASVNNVPVDGRTIRIDPNSVATIAVALPIGPAQNSVYLEFLGIHRKIASGRSEGGRWSTTVRVQDYARWGVGLYRVVWESRSPDGTVVCSASTTVHIPGFPLGTATGIAGAASVAVGLAGLALTLKTTINEGARWTFKVVTKAKVEREKEQRRLRLKPAVSVSQTLLGTLWGLLLSGGTLATLQQTALSLPTIQLAFQLTIPVTLLSVIASWLRPVRA